MTFDAKDKKALVAGLGRSGIAAAKLLLAKGASVAATDAKSASELGEDALELQAQGVDLHLGHETRDLPADTDLLVTSPGVPQSHPLLRVAQARGTKVIGELELAWRSLPDGMKVAAITGSNGKSTTVTLCGHLLTNSGVDTWVGGNLGEPLSCLALQSLDADTKPPTWAVLEVSSFQLEWAPTFAPPVASILNVSANHLDRHGSIEEYAHIKGRIWAGQDQNGLAIFNRDDPWSNRLAGAAPGTRMSFGSSAMTGPGARFDQNTVTVRVPESDEATYDLDSFQAIGAHNRSNAAAALLVATTCGGDPVSMQDALASYAPLRHRLQPLGSAAGVHFYNDSKATTPDAVAQSLACFDTPVVLIAGGRDKGGNFKRLRSLVAERTRRIILIGEATDKIEDAWMYSAAISRAASLQDAFEQATKTAEPGDVVLFSPGCASFDMFENFEVRGDAFVTLVEAHQAQHQTQQGDSSR